MNILKLGDSGQDVKQLQELLISHGFSISVDGQFGPVTKRAVREFQESKSLNSDGIVGPKTMEWLEKAHNIEIIDIVDADELDERTKKCFKTLDAKAQKIFLPFILEAKKIAKYMGCEYRAISGNRGGEEQNALYAQGRTTPGRIVTNARFGYSNHNWGCALDFGCFKNGQYLDDSSPKEAEKVHKAVSQICGKYNLDWGGNWKFKDTPHFEIRSPLTMAEKRARYKKFGSIL